MGVLASNPQPDLSPRHVWSHGQWPAVCRVHGSLLTGLRKPAWALSSGVRSRHIFRLTSVILTMSKILRI